jgi:hypothetical protein
MINMEPIDGGMQQQQQQQPHFTAIHAYTHNVAVTSQYCAVCKHARLKNIHLFVHPPDHVNLANAHPHTGNGIIPTYYPPPYALYPMSVPWSTPPPGYNNGVPYAATPTNELATCISQLSMYSMNGTTTSPIIVPRFNESPITISTPHHYVDVRPTRPVAPIDKWMPSFAPGKLFFNFNNVKSA